MTRSSRPFTAEKRRFAGDVAPGVTRDGTGHRDGTDGDGRAAGGGMAGQMAVMMAAIDRLEKQVVAINARLPGLDQAAHHVTAGSAAASAQSAQHLDNAAVELTAVISTTEQATEEILAACEAIDETAAGLLDLEPAGLDHDHLAAELNRIRSDVVRIFQAASFQDLTGQRLTKVTRMLGQIDGRLREVEAVIGLAEQAADVMAATAAPAAAVAAPVLDPAHPHFDESALLNGPAATGEGISQDDIDKLFG